MRLYGYSIDANFEPNRFKKTTHNEENKAIENTTGQDRNTIQLLMMKRGSFVPE